MDLSLSLSLSYFYFVVLFSLFTSCCFVFGIYFSPPHFNSRDIAEGWTATVKSIAASQSISPPEAWRGLVDDPPGLLLFFFYVRPSIISLFRQHSIACNSPHISSHSFPSVAQTLSLARRSQPRDSSCNFHRTARVHQGSRVPLRPRSSRLPPPPPPRHLRGHATVPFQSNITFISHSSVCFFFFFVSFFARFLSGGSHPYLNEEAVHIAQV